MTEGTFVSFCIPSHSRDTKGIVIEALTVELKDGSFHGVIHLPSVIDAGNAAMLITALQAALFSLEGRCHNHPTHPEKGSSEDAEPVRSWLDSRSNQRVS